MIEKTELVKPPPKPAIYKYYQEYDLVEKADILKLDKLKQIYFFKIPQLSSHSHHQTI